MHGHQAATTCKLGPGQPTPPIPRARSVPRTDPPRWPVGPQAQGHEAPPVPSLQPVLPSSLCPRQRGRLLSSPGEERQLLGTEVLPCCPSHSLCPAGTQSPPAPQGPSVVHRAVGSPPRAKWLRGHTPKCVQPHLATPALWYHVCKISPSHHTKTKAVPLHTHTHPISVQTRTHCQHNCTHPTNPSTDTRPALPPHNAPLPAPHA